MTIGDPIFAPYRGATGVDAGFFYCPYIPLQYIGDNEIGTGTPTIPFRTRYTTYVHDFGAAYPTIVENDEEEQWIRIV